MIQAPRPHARPTKTCPPKATHPTIHSPDRTGIPNPKETKRAPSESKTYIYKCTKQARKRKKGREKKGRSNPIR
ncbi:hypothetical protein JB92DRAFT_2846335, partial [Gautieria morchelliformis]